VVAIRDRVGAEVMHEWRLAPHEFDRHAEQITAQPPQCSFGRLLALQLSARELPRRRIGLARTAHDERLAGSVLEDRARLPHLALPGLGHRSHASKAIAIRPRGAVRPTAERTYLRAARLTVHRWRSRTESTPSRCPPDCAFLPTHSSRIVCLPVA